MSRYYQTVCRTEDEACAAFHATDRVFGSIEEVTGYGRKRYSESLLWRFDDELPVVERMLAALRETGLFTEVREISGEFFWNTRSYAV
jgi:hypothetical protein